MCEHIVGVSVRELPGVVSGDCKGFASEEVSRGISAGFASAKGQV